ncbi:MAG TPA: efflux RND transporter periplasmic adaptor subunit [Thermoanaerobaculia bacterium]|nr:efflux RND transporter periplasmic adaptor subunit [Thermoanaerobaculia bacterium]
MLMHSNDRHSIGAFLPRKRAGSAAALALLAFLAAACSAPESRKPPPAATSAIPTEVIRLSAVPRIHETSGTVSSRIESTVAARIMGTVTAVYVDEGDRVRRGQPLLEIDSRETDAQFRAAEAAVGELSSAIAAADAGLTAATANAELAESTWRRYVALQERGSVSPQEFEEVQARKRGASADRDRARKSLEALIAKKTQAEAQQTLARVASSWARLTAPIDGVVTARLIDPGDQARPGRPLLNLEGVDMFEVLTTLGEDRMHLAQPGARVSIRIDAISMELTGTIAHVSPAVDPSSRGALVRIALPTHPALRSGLFARVGFSEGEREVITVPTDSIVRRGQLEGVWVIDREGVSRFRLVKSGRVKADRTEILSGIEPGERLVTGATEALRDGDLVAAGATRDGERS